jgi:hypothetical protein
MSLFLARWFCLATFLLPLTALHSQTTAALTDATSTKKGSWQLTYSENFEEATPLIPLAPLWSLDTYQRTDKWADGGAFFRKQGIEPPVAYRIEAPFSTGGWLSVAAYSRSNTTNFNDLFQVVPDPMNPQNHVLMVSSPLHTDGTVIRSTAPLPAQYRVCLKVGFASFGDGIAGGLNGYLGGETPEPWLTGDATVENGFYWLTILDATPRPHNNIWIHHHRKVTIDSDNNTEAWTNQWEDNNWVADGQHPIMMFGTSKEGPDDDYTGRPFISWSQGMLQPFGDIRTADAYNDNTWYSACIERNEKDFVLTTSGNFKWGGQQTYVGTIPVKSVTQTGDAFPDFFMFGDPHNNYYRGSVYYDDITLETWQAAKQ